MGKVYSFKQFYPGFIKHDSIHSFFSWLTSCIRIQAVPTDPVLMDRAEAMGPTIQHASANMCSVCNPKLSLQTKGQLNNFVHVGVRLLGMQWIKIFNWMN